MAYKKPLANYGGELKEIGSGDTIDPALIPYNGNISGAQNLAKGANIASASTTDLSSATGNYVNITGTATITALETLPATIQAGAVRLLRVVSTPKFVHNATSLIMPGATDFVPNAGDMLEFISEGSGNWRMTRYFPVQSSPINVYGHLMARLAGNIMF